MKLIGQEIEIEHVNVCFFAKVLYSAVVYMAMKHEIDELDRKLSEIDLHINTEILRQYLESVNDNSSM